MFGRVTRQKICQPLAPQGEGGELPAAALGLHERDELAAQATKGKVTKVVAKTMPAGAKMIGILWSISQGPNQPRAPKTRT